LDPKQARETYLDALSAANFAGRLASTVDLPQVAVAALAGPAAGRSPRAPDLLLDGLSALLVQGYEKAAPMVRKALGAMLDGDLTTAESVRWVVHRLPVSPRRLGRLCVGRALGATARDRAGRRCDQRASRSL